MMIFSSKKSKTQYSAHLLIADTFFRNRKCPLWRGLTVFDRLDADQKKDYQRK